VDSIQDIAFSMLILALALAPTLAYNPFLVPFETQHRKNRGITTTTQNQIDTKEEQK